MSVNKVILVDMYLTKKMSIPEISKETGVARSMVRYYLLKQGVKLRSKREALSLVKHKLSSVHAGKTRVFSDDWKRHISEGKKKYGKTHSKGYGIHHGYIRLSRGNECGRLEHVVIMEQHVGRKLRKEEVVHHINGNRSDNRIENLRLMTRSEHTSLHMRERKFKQSLTLNQY